MITKFIKIFSVYNNIEPLIYIFTISRCTLTKNANTVEIVIGQRYRSSNQNIRYSAMYSLRSDMHRLLLFLTIELIQAHHSV